MMRKRKRNQSPGDVFDASCGKLFAGTFFYSQICGSETKVPILRCLDFLILRLGKPFRQLVRVPRAEGKLSKKFRIATMKLYGPTYSVAAIGSRFLVIIESFPAVRETLQLEDYQ